MRRTRRVLEWAGSALLLLGFLAALFLQGSAKITAMGVGTCVSLTEAK